jgi:hypothetical protein
MRKKQILNILLIILLILNYISVINALAVEYNLELSNNAEIIWKVDDYDKDVYKEIFLKKADFDKGDQQKIKITNIDTREQKWVVSYLVWKYTSNTQDFSNPADGEKLKTVYKDPKDQVDAIIELEDIAKMWVVPSPFTNYIEEFRDKFDKQGWDISVDGDTLIAKYGIETAQYEIQITYANDGLAQTVEYVDNNGHTFVKISLLRQEIPGYPVLFIILFLCGVISIIIWRIKLYYYTD